jgi:hypothetical protein
VNYLYYGDNLDILRKHSKELVIGAFLAVAWASKNPLLIIAALGFAGAYMAFKISELLQIILKIAQPTG